MTEDVRAFIDLIKWLLGGMAVLAGILWGISLWEIRQLRRSLHDLRDNLPQIIIQWAEIAIKTHPGSK